MALRQPPATSQQPVGCRPLGVLDVGRHSRGARVHPRNDEVRPRCLHFAVVLQSAQPTGAQRLRVRWSASAVGCLAPRCGLILSPVSTRNPLMRTTQLWEVVDSCGNHCATTAGSAPALHQGPRMTAVVRLRGASRMGCAPVSRLFVPNHQRGRRQRALSTLEKRLATLRIAEEWTRCCTLLLYCWRPRLARSDDRRGNSNRTLDACPPCGDSGR